MPPPHASRPIVLSTDCGVEMDDQWALAHLTLSPELDLRGVITAHAPVLVTVADDGRMGPQGRPPARAAEGTARAARDTLNHLPVTGPPPVFAGSDTPLPDRRTPRPGRGMEFLLETAQAHSPDNRLIVLVIGPATDVASALLTDPTLAARIEVVAMAFNAWPDGTDLFNVKNDIAAWQALLDTPTPVTVGDAAVCIRHLRMTRARAKGLFGDRGASGRYLMNLLISWLDHNGDEAKTIAGDPEAWPVWDEVTVAYLLGLTTQDTHPRPRVRDDMTFAHPEESAHGGSVIRWITSIDAEALWADFVRKLDAARAGTTAESGAE